MTAENESAPNAALKDMDRSRLWHAMSPYRGGTAEPMIAAEAKGAWITDAEGKRYLDGMSGLWCVNVGYGREELAKAAYDQLVKMSYYPLSQSHEPAILLAEQLSDWLGGDYVVFFSNSGSEANETAFKIARQYHEQTGTHGKTKFVSRYRAYHGNTMGALAATGQAQRKYKYEPLAAGFVHVRPPDAYRRPDGMTAEQFYRLCAREIEETILWEGKETVAGVIMEPAITGGGVIVPDTFYMEEVERICRRHNVLLIIDEVICGFGRSGMNFGHHNYGIEPDIVTMAKGLTSGYLPLSATAVKRSVYEAFQSEESYAHFRHINTFGGNPASCALALANLRIMKDERLVERSKRLGERLGAGLAELAGHPLVGDVRRFGFLAGVELVADRHSKRPLDVSAVNRIIADCKEKGLLIGKNGETVAGFNNVLTICPPLSSTDDDLAFLLRTLADALEPYGETEGL